MTTIATAVKGVAGLWLPSEYPANDWENEYLRGQIELIADVFTVPEEYQGDGMVTKEYIYNLVRAELGLPVPAFLVSENMQPVWEMIVGQHAGASSVDTSYTLGMLELFVIQARRWYGEKITAEDIPTLKELLKKDANIA
jgi:hypothetical protein